MAGEANIAARGLPAVWRFGPAAAALVVFAAFLRLVGPVARGAAPAWSLHWVPSLGIEFAFRVDGLALAFALLISGIGALVFLYAATYFHRDRRLGPLLATLVAFAIAMLGLVTANDAITLFVFWEATTITSWLLVGFNHERSAARAAALQALIVTGLGGLALLAGLVLMGAAAGTYAIDGLVAAGAVLKASPAYPAILVLVLAGCFAKSAQFPFHFWLPNAMAAPTPVSAYLHSATMVKAGIYLMARFTPALGDTPAWTAALVGAGALTMLIGAVWALREVDLKLMLARTTVMALGLMTLLIGIGTPEAMLAAMVFLLVHALYKAALFLAVGMIERSTGVRSYTLLAGLARPLPGTMLVAALAALSMAGLPPLFGFIGKELVYEALRGGGGALALTAATLVANAAMVACAGAIALRPFLGALRAPAEAPTEPAAGLWLGPAVLAALGLAIGLAPGALETALVAPMLAATGMPPGAHLALWHGFGPALVLSLATFLLGGLAYLGLDRLRQALLVAEEALPRAEAVYAALTNGVLSLSAAAGAVLQNGRMTSYLRRSFVVLGLLIWTAILAGRATWPDLSPSRHLIDWAIAAIIAGSILVVLRTRSRVAAITALGGIGVGIALVFVLYSAIDVAMTQLFVEILVVVFLAIAMVRLPPTGVVPFRAGNALVAAVLGIGTTLAVLSVLGTELDLSLTRFFEQESVPSARGHNIVNVILVDFRGFDTMGEIAVIVIAGLASVAALWAGRRVAR